MKRFIKSFREANKAIFAVMILLIIMVAIILPVLFIDWLSNKFTNWYYLLCIPYTYILIFVLDITLFAKMGDQE